MCLLQRKRIAHRFAPAPHPQADRRRRDLHTFVWLINPHLKWSAGSAYNRMVMCLTNLKLMSFVICVQLFKLPGRKRREAQFSSNLLPYRLVAFLLLATCCGTKNHGAEILQFVVRLREETEKKQEKNGHYDNVEINLITQKLTLFCASKEKKICSQYSLHLNGTLLF